MEITDINADELAVLKVLDEHTRTWGEMCISFDYMTGATEVTLDRKTIGKTCRSLNAKGLADFYRGLMNDDGEVAGAGYCISREGQLTNGKRSLNGKGSRSKATSRFQSPSTSAPSAALTWTTSTSSAWTLSPALRTWMIAR
jgi:hypothetical protein